MDWPTIVSEMGPWGCTLAVVVWAFLQKRNDPEKDEIFVRLRALEELAAGEEYWFAAYFTPDNWSCTVNALGLEKSSAFDVNLVGSRSVGVLTELPASLGALSYETLAWYMSAM